MRKQLKDITENKIQGPCLAVNQRTYWKSRTTRKSKFTPIHQSAILFTPKRVFQHIVFFYGKWGPEMNEYQIRVSLTKKG